MDDQEELVLDEHFGGFARLTGRIEGYGRPWITLRVFALCKGMSIDLDRDGAVILRDWLNKYLGE